MLFQLAIVEMTLAIPEIAPPAAVNVNAKRLLEGPKIVRLVLMAIMITRIANRAIVLQMELF